MTHSTALRHRGRRRSGGEKTDRTAKDTLGLFAAALGVLTKMALFIGFLALAIYLGAAQHVVTGVNLTDAFLLAALAFVLGLLAMGVLAAGVVLAAPPLSFMTKAAAWGLSTRHLSTRQRLLVWGFPIAIAFAAVGIPVIEFHLVKHRDLSSALGISVLNAAPALILAGCWYGLQRLCRPPGMKAQSFGDAFFDSLSAAAQLMLSYLVAILLLLRLEAVVLMWIAAIGLVCSFGIHLVLAEGPRVKPSWAYGGRRMVAIAVIAVIPIALLLPAFNRQTGIARAFEALGLMLPHATVELSAANLRRLELVALQHDLPLQICRNTDGGGMLTDVRVLWHALGSIGLVELWPEPTNPRAYGQGRKPSFDTAFFEQVFSVLGWRGVRVPLENAGMAPITGSHLHCLELSGLLFDGDSAVVSAEARILLARQLDALKDRLDGSTPAQTVLRIDITGHADPAHIDITGHADPAQRQRDRNAALAQRRARAVRQVVDDWIRQAAAGWTAAKIEIRSQSSLEPARKCDLKDPQEKEACHAFNRRVVLRLTTGEPS